MMIDDIANYCEFKECEVRLGAAEVGFIEIDGNGVKHLYNYNRYLSFNELSSLPPTGEVLKKATVFKIKLNDEIQTLSREAFEAELEVFRQKVGIE